MADQSQRDDFLAARERLWGRARYGTGWRGMLMGRTRVVNVDDLRIVLAGPPVTEAALIDAVNAELERQIANPPSGPFPVDVMAIARAVVDYLKYPAQTTKPPAS